MDRLVGMWMYYLFAAMYYGMEWWGVITYYTPFVVLGMIGTVVCAWMGENLRLREGEWK